MICAILLRYLQPVTSHHYFLGNLAMHVPRSCLLPEGIVLPPGLSCPNLRVRVLRQVT